MLSPARPTLPATLASVWLGAMVLCHAACTGPDAPMAADEPSAPPSHARAAAPSPAAERMPATLPDAPAALDRAAPAPEPAPEPAAPPRTFSETYLHFEGACQAEDVVTIAAVGDLLIHRELQRQAYAAPEGFKVLWSSILDLLGKADISYANLEGPLAQGINKKGELETDPGLRFDGSVYTGYPRFNYHPSMARDLVESGIDIVSTANNHALDRGELGVERTIDALRAAGLKYTGTRRRPDPARKRAARAPWHTITEARGMRIAWLACTSHTIVGKDEPDQVLDCYKDPTSIADLVRQLAHDDAVDAIIVTPHWGKEYVHEPTDKQRQHARAWIEAGATAIIGSHPHVLQPWDKLRTEDGREAFILYSLGNFVSHQPELERRSSMVLYLGLARRADGVVVPVGAAYVPLTVRMVGDAEAFFAEAIDRAGGPADARALIVSLFGPDNILAPDAELDLRPHCHP